VKIKIALLTTLMLAFSSIGLAQSRTKAIAPNIIVQNLYAAQKAGSSPFFQTKDRAAVDNYFTKDLADLIWQDAVAANGEVGAIDFDPLYNAQDTKITAFKIGKPMYGEGNLNLADVPVTFKNMGKDGTVLFRLERDSPKTVWKISDVYYPSNPESSSSLKDILSDALKVSEASTAPTSNMTSDIRSVDFLNYSYRPSVCSEDVGLPETVKVRDGKFKDGDNFFDVAKNEVAYGDLNGDGSEDAVVLIRCGSSAGTLRAFEIHAYSLRSGRAELLARLDSIGAESDYQKSYAGGTVFYAGENGPKIVSGHLIIEALTDGSFAGPENVTTFDYQLSGDKLVLSGKPTRTKRPE